MRSGTPVLILAAASIVLVGFTLLGCSKSTSPTNPYDGSSGGSGSGNTPFDSGTLVAPAQYVRMFPNASTVGYHCRFHASMGMTGTVTVAAGAADSAVVTASGTSFAPAAVSIRPGGYVRWNVTTGQHTVTSN